MSLRRSVIQMFLVAALVVAVSVTGCSGLGIEEKRRLDEVHQRIAEAQREPAMRAHAPSFLAIADETLQEARGAGDPAEARHLIYLAQRRLEIARSVAGLKRAAARIEDLRREPDASAAVPGRSGSRKKSAGAEIAESHDEAGRLTAARTNPGTADITVAAPVPPKKPHTGRAEVLDKQASIPETERQSTGGAKERIWKVLPMESLFADTELSRLAATVGRDLAPLVRFLRENEGSIVLIKGNLVKDKPTERELAWSVHAAEAIKTYLVEADIESNRIFTLGRIEKDSDRAEGNAARNFPVGRIEIALFDGRHPSSSRAYAPLR